MTRKLSKQELYFLNAASQSTQEVAKAGLRDSQFNALSDLEERGLITLKVKSTFVRYTVTAAGRAALEAAQKRETES